MLVLPVLVVSPLVNLILSLSVCSKTLELSSRIDVVR